MYISLILDQTLKEIFYWNPLQNTDIVMIIILPNEIDGLLNLQTNFSWEILTNASRLYDEIELYLPKFKIEFTVDLKNILSKVWLKNFICYIKKVAFYLYFEF